MSPPSLLQALEAVASPACPSQARFKALEGIPQASYDAAKMSDALPAQECALLVHFLSDDQAPVVSLAAKKLGELIEDVPFPMVYEAFAEPLVNALTSDPHEDVMALVLQQCAKCLKSPEDTEAFLSTPLLFGIVQYVEDAPTDLCNRIASLFSGLIIRSPSQLHVILSDAILAQFHQMVLGAETTQQFRIYDLIIQIALASPEAFDRIVYQGSLLDELVTSFSQMKDPLYGMLTTEVFSQLGQSDLGFHFLLDQGIIAETILILRDRSDEGGSALALIIPKLLQLIARLSSLHDLTGVQSKYVILDALESLYNHTEDKEVKIHIIHIIGFLGSNPHNLPLVLQSSLSDILTSLLPHNRSIGEMRVAATEALASVVSSPHTLEGDLDGLVYEMYRRIDQAQPPRYTTLKGLVAGVTQPLPEILSASYAAIYGLAQRTWGRNLMSIEGEEADDQVTCMEHLLSRSPGTSSDAMKWKHAILQVILKDPLASESFSPEWLRKAQVYVKEGVYYIPTESAVLIATK